MGKCPKCGKRVEIEDVFLDDDFGGYEKYEVECSGCGYYWSYTIDARTGLELETLQTSFGIV